MDIHDCLLFQGGVSLRRIVTRPYSSPLSFLPWRLVAVALGPALLPICLLAQSVAGSDAFDDRLLIAGSGIGSGNLLLATQAADDPELPGRPRGQTLWWRFVAPGPGRVRIEPALGSLNPLVAVYRGSNLAALSLVASNTVVFCSPCFGCETRLRSGLTFDVRPGEEYAVAADWHDFVRAGTAVEWPDPFAPPRPPAGGPFELQFTFVPAPANDDLARSEVLAGELVDARAALWSASSEPGEPLPVGNPGGRSVWYTWTAPATGQLQITNGQTRIYPEVAASAGPVPWGSLGELANAWPLLGAYWSLPPGYGSVGLVITGGGGGFTGMCDFIEQDPAPPFFPIFTAYLDGPEVPTLLATGTNLDCFVSAGTVLRIAVAGNAGTGEDIDFQLRLTPRPANADFAQRLALRGHSAEASGHTVGTGWPFGVTPEAGFQNQPRAWWTWTAPAEGPVWLGAVVSDRRLFFEVYRGLEPAQFQAVSAGETATTFYAEQGVAYQVGVAVADAPGAYQFSLRQLPARLRPALVTGDPDHPALVFGEASASRILVQVAGPTRWLDAAFAAPAADLPGDAWAYWLPLETVPGPITAGNVRVWLLDFPVPDLRLQALRSSPLSSPTLMVGIEGVPGQHAEIETSTDLSHWSRHSELTLGGFAGTALDSRAATEGQRFYRAREVALPLTALRPFGP